MADDRPVVGRHGGVLPSLSHSRDGWPVAGASIRQRGGSPPLAVALDNAWVNLTAAIRLQTTSVVHPVETTIESSADGSTKAKVVPPLVARRPRKQQPPVVAGMDWRSSWRPFLARQHAGTQTDPISSEEDEADELEIERQSVAALLLFDDEK